MADNRTVAVYCDFSSVSEDEIKAFGMLVKPHITEELKLRDESLCARVLLTYMLQKYFGVTDFAVAVRENGKPYLIGSNLQFNFSHCLKRVICSVSASEVGCDVQDIRAMNPRVVSRFYNPDEGMLLSADHNSDEHFTKLWVLKEAILKYKGDGIAGGLSEYSFPEYLMSDSFSAYGVNFKSFEKDGYIYGVCYEDDEITVSEADVKEILKTLM